MHMISENDFIDWKSENVIASGPTEKKGRKQLIITIRYDKETGGAFALYRVNVKDANGKEIGSYGHSFLDMAVNTYNQF